ncbi:cell wall-associated NlpC family hydrolase [Halopolyspora algeriensis]|uniref:Cell wall-associated NlpC family hydrolase n=1 Tax=Halopolyspora algeriensis TaxID=1500506 RepID=A0A368VX11_9ACTN|nr:C40 family peptidase [Halopolyspora algeriensis]RCW44053.1 cell wall-associated NlpC family hydrolase [Halopolyspora algeriensis]TQM53448.1 cell wall-associated NlpC family hydrolase [Halopolyspora algeriensis]
MTSHRLKRSMRGTLTATAVAAVVTMSSVPATADPQLPDSAPEAVEKLRELSREAEKITEKYHRAQDDHDARVADLERAKAAVAEASKAAEQARAEEEKFRSKVDELTGSAYRGARLNQLSALLVSESPGAYLDRAATMDALAEDNNEAIQALAAATHRAEEAERRAAEAQQRAAKAAAEAARLKEEIADKKATMEERIAEVRDHLEDLTGAERAAIPGGNTDYEFQGGAGTAAGAVQAALSKQGSPYVWGAEGPNRFDCSGLMYWAYQQVGVSIPRSSSAQAQTGKPVSASQLKPGDLVFYYSPVSHVGMYVGNGNVVHAPTAGSTVHVTGYRDVAPVNRMRRIAG